MFVTRLQRSRRHLQATALPFVDPAPFVAPTSPNAQEPPFITRSFGSRKHQWASDLLQHPFPTTAAQAPWPSFDAVKTLKSAFSRTHLKNPEHNEYPPPPPSQAAVGAILKIANLRRRSRAGLFLVAADYLEASVVQLVIATQNIDLVRRRRPTRRTIQVVEPPLFVEAAPIAGEEFVTAWAAVVALRRFETSRTLQKLPFRIVPQEFSPGWKLATALRRSVTERREQRLPTLSFFQVPGFPVVAFTPRPTLKRRDIARRTSFPLVPPHITVVAPPFIGAQGFPAFQVVQRPMRGTSSFTWTPMPTLTPAGAAISVPGLQPPHYVIGRMSPFGLGIRAPISLAGVTVDGRMAPTHAVDGSLDPSEGHGGSVL